MVDWDYDFQKFDYNVTKGYISSADLSADHNCWLIAPPPIQSADKTVNKSHSLDDTGTFLFCFMVSRFYACLFDKELFSHKRYFVVSRLGTWIMFYLKNGGAFEIDHNEKW